MLNQKYCFVPGHKHECTQCQNCKEIDRGKNQAMLCPN